MVSTEYSNASVGSRSTLFRRRLFQTGYVGRPFQTRRVQDRSRLKTRTILGHSRLRAFCSVIWEKRNESPLHTAHFHCEETETTDAYFITLFLETSMVLLTIRNSIRTKLVRAQASTQYCHRLNSVECISALSLLILTLPPEKVRSPNENVICF